MQENKENKNEEKCYVVYKHTSPNGRCYIGITGQSPPEKRWANGRGYIANKYFNDEIMRYGWNNFQHEILFENLTKNEAQQKEIELIAYYKSNQDMYGYNISKGGACVGTHTEESKMKMSEHAYKKSCVSQFDKEGNFIKNYESIKRASIETGIARQNIVACCNDRMKTAGTFIWRYSSNELTAEHIVWCNEQINKSVKQKQKTDKKKSTNQKKNNKKIIVQYTFSGKIVERFENLVIAEESTGVCKSNISKCCRNKLGSAGGYIWKYDGDENVDFFSNEYNYKTNKQILQYTKNGKFIQTYNSIIEASTINSIDQSSITKCCKNKVQSAGGYIWRYASEISDTAAHISHTLPQTI